MKKPAPNRINKANLTKVELEARLKLRSARETLSSQLHAADWCVKASVEAARAGDLRTARDEAQRAAGLAEAALDHSEHLQPLLQLLGMKRG